MQVQSGGVDPGLAALIAAILSGGVGYVGYKHDTRSSEDVITERLRMENELRFKEIERAKEAAEALNAKAKMTTADYEKIKAELDELKAKYTVLESASASLSKASTTFKGASSEALKAAVPIVIRKLSAKYTWIQPDGSNVPKTMKALDYPASYSGRLARMSLYDFYQKRVLKALEEDKNPKKGGRGKRRRGGMDTKEEREKKEEALADFAPAVNVEDKEKTETFLEEEPPAEPPAPPAEPPATSPPLLTIIPSYEDFALAYTKAIEEATAAIPTARQKNDEQLASYAVGKRVGNDIVAKKAAEAIIPKLDAAIQSGEEALAIPVPDDKVEELKPLKTALGEKLDIARELVGNPGPGEVPKKKRFGFFGGASNLREVQTETEWKELNTPTSAKDLLEEVKAATKAYKDAATKAAKAKKDVPPEDDTKFTGVNPFSADGRLQVASAPLVAPTTDPAERMKALSLYTANPLRRPAQITSGEAKEAPANKLLRSVGTRVLVPKRAGTKRHRNVRKSTLKKRRGGK